VFAVLRRLRTLAARQAKPVPSRSIVAGSGTEAAGERIGDGCKSTILTSELGRSGFCRAKSSVIGTLAKPSDDHSGSPATTLGEIIMGVHLVPLDASGASVSCGCVMLDSVAAMSVHSIAFPNAVLAATITTKHPPNNFIKYSSFYGGNTRQAQRLKIYGGKTCCAFERHCRRVLSQSQYYLMNYLMNLSDKASTTVTADFCVAMALLSVPL